MVLREVGEHRRIKFDTGHTVLVERMGGNLHDHIVHALVPHDGQRVLQFHHIRRRIVNGEYFFLHHNLNGTDKPHLITSFAQDGADKIAGRGLAIGARNADYPHLLRRVVMEERHDNVQSRFQLRHLQDSNTFRHVHRLSRAGGQDGLCPLLHSLRNKLMTIHMEAFYAHKECTLCCLAGVMLNSLDLYILIAGNYRTIYQFCQLR